MGKKWFAALLIVLLLGAAVVIEREFGAGSGFFEKPDKENSGLVSSGSPKTSSFGQPDSETAAESSSAAATGPAVSDVSETVENRVPSSAVPAGASAPGSSLPEKKPSSTSTAPQNRASGWEQLDRLRFVEGTVLSYRENSDGTGSLSLRVTKNFHNGTDPVDDPNDPFRPGTEKKFVLQKFKENILTTGADVVVYECNVSPAAKPEEQFAGAAVLYYKKDAGFVDAAGKIAVMPPKNAPEFRKVFS